MCHWPGCGKGFARQHDCKRHEQLHTNYRPFTCEGCNRNFARMDALNRHCQYPPTYPLPPKSNLSSQCDPKAERNVPSCNPKVEATPVVRRGVRRRVRPPRINQPSKGIKGLRVGKRDLRI